MFHLVMPRGRWARYGLLFALWTVLGLIDGVQYYIHLNKFRGYTLPLGEMMLSGLGDWYGWAFLAPLITQFARHYPLSGRPSKGRLALHLGFAAAIICVKTFLDVGLGWLIHGDLVLHRPFLPSLLESLQYFITSKFMIYILVYGLILGGYEFFRAGERSRARDLAASRLQTQLVQAQLQVLKMQLQPHFLFNTLHAISALLHKDPGLADKMIARLGELLRATLDHGGSQEVTLQQELDFVRPYLEIEQARCGPRLRVALAVDPEALDALVPSMILQPLVENAIRHGVSARPGPGRVEVRARRRGQLLLIEVCDDGPGLSPRHREGLGLTNTRARLQGLYGPEHELALANGTAGGVVASLALPYRAVAASSDLPEPAEDAYHSVGATQ